MKTKTKNNEFIQKANIIHNNKYDYSNINYINNHTKIKIICKAHGEFYKDPSHHLRGQGCPECSHRKRLNTDSFIEKSKKIHNDFYDYSKTIYKNQDIKLKIICPTHGEFEQIPYHHLAGHKCKSCSINNERFYNAGDLFVKRANEKWNNFYDYSKIKYISARKKIIIICPLHGEFLQSPDTHLKHKCLECSIIENSDNQRGNTEDFIIQAKKIHGNLFNYNKVSYKGNKIKVEIICKEHGSFFQTPAGHLYGKGCSLCGNTSKKEKIIENILTDKNIKFIREKTFEGCKNINLLRFDFYLPKYNICIEYDGIQHFKSIEIWGGEKKLLENKFRDSIKSNFCKLNKIKLIRINYKENLVRKINALCFKILS